MQVCKIYPDSHGVRRVYQKPSHETGVVYKDLHPLTRLALERVNHPEIVDSLILELIEEIKQQQPLISGKLDEPCTGGYHCRIIRSSIIDNTPIETRRFRNPHESLFDKMDHYPDDFF